MQNTRISELESLRPTALDAGLVFSGKESGKLIQGYDKPSAYTPAINPDYLFHEAGRDIVVWLMNPADPLYVFGPTGCGKTSCIKQLAARLNYPVFEVTGHGQLEFADLVGHLAVKDGSMVFEYGPLALAMRYGGMLLLNEIDITPPDVAAGLNNVLDGSPLCIAENSGELVVPHPMFRFAATANTNGGGDETGLYQGTQRQNIAWLDRFMLCELRYPEPDVEKSLLSKLFPILPEELCAKLVDFAGEVREQFMGDKEGKGLANAIEITLSTRTLLRWAELTVRFQPLAHKGIQPVSYALDRALGYRACRETRAMLHELAQRIFPQEYRLGEPQRDSPHMTSESDNASCFLTGLRALTNPFSHIVLEYMHSPHSGKFWKGSLAPGILTLNWGKLGTAGQTRGIPASECRDRNPAKELQHRALEKIKKGYVLNRQKSSL